MTLGGPEPTLKLKTVRFSDIDEFRTSIRAFDADCTPLARTISAQQTILDLPGCCVALMHSFPRINDAALARNCTSVCFTMDDGVPIRFNGIQRDRGVFVFGSDGAAFTTVEHVELRYAGIVFTPTIEDRGWPHATGHFRIFELGPAGCQRLRQLVTQILSVAPQLAEASNSAGAAAGIRESPLASIDAALNEVVPARWTAYANSTRQFMLFRNIEAVLSSKVAEPVYSEQLAQQVGVSLRTVHDTILRYRGMSLHRYLKLRRLWLVRKQLLAGTQSIKACALAFGFWHLGNFSASYRNQFGESPSETIANVRQR
jgi:AraC family ethanolamine operon transcriptional activator